MALKQSLGRRRLFVKGHLKPLLTDIAAFFVGGKRVNFTMKQPTRLAGFTLIEVLVIVLIISILTSVALPQYQKTVAKAQAVQALVLLQSLQQAYKAYFLANGKWATSLDDLDVSIPWTGNARWRNDLNSARSINGWSVQLQREDLPAIYVGRLTGNYAGTGFAYFFEDWGNPSSLFIAANTLTCVENREGVNGIAFSQPEGSFCRKVMGSTQVIQSGMRTRYFNMR